MDDLSLAADLVREAGLLAAGMLADGLDTEYKTSVSDVVSAADHAAEELITAESRVHRLLDAEVAREFYDRDGSGIPRAWLARVRSSLKTNAPMFSAPRMLRDYEQRYYSA